MEFYAEVRKVTLKNKQLVRLLSIARLPELCRSINTVIADHVDNGIIYCVWGEFIVHREEIEYGVRFSLPHCPNALAWTVTLDESSRQITIHCTINKKQHDVDFIHSIEQFVGDWKEGLCDMKIV